MHRRIVWIALAAVLVGVGLAWVLTSERQPAPDSGTELVIEVLPTATPAPEQRIVLLFAGDDGLLHPELRITRFPDGTDARLRVVVRELLNGSDSGFAPVIPWPAELETVFLDGSGNAFVGITAPPADLEVPIAGSSTEMMICYGLINSILLNCPELRAVQVIFGDRESSTLTGHLDLSRPLRLNKSLIAAS